MPYKYRKKRAQYMIEYRRFKRHQILNIKKALIEGKPELARRILEQKPSISVIESSSKRKREKKR